MLDLLTLENHCLKVVISPKVGASIYSFQYFINGQWVDVMRPTPETALKANEPGKFSCFNMIPYSNRIAHGILLHRAHTYRLAINTADGHSIHGEVRSRPWQVIKHTPNMMELEFLSPDYQDISWPFWFKARLKYELVENQFFVTTCIENISDQEMPVGMGIHPYFVRKLTAVDDQVLVQIPVIGVYPGETPIPTGKWVEVPEELDFSQTKILTTAFIDKCFRVASQPAVLTWVNSGVCLKLEWDEVFKHLILYCPQGDERYFAVEPVTNCNNGFNMANQGIEDTGTIYLEPGERLVGTIKLSLEQQE